MNAIGIDVSKGKSMVTIVQPFGVVVAEPFEVSHNGQALSVPVERVKRLPGATKVVMECTGTYYEPIANALHNAGIFVSVVNPLLIDEYGTNRVRKVKTDKKDAFKIANFALDRWTHYKYSEVKAAQIHAYSRTQVNSLPMTDSVMRIVEESAKLLNSTLETLAAIRVEMDKLSSTLPEYETVMSQYGVGRTMCSQLIAKIGDVRRFERSKSLVAMAGIDPPPNQSGQFDPDSRSISKRGSSLLRKTLF